MWLFPKNLLTKKGLNTYYKQMNLPYECFEVEANGIEHIIKVKDNLNKEYYCIPNRPKMLFPINKTTFYIVNNRNIFQFIVQEDNGLKTIYNADWLNLYYRPGQIVKENLIFIDIDINQIAKNDSTLYHLQNDYIFGIKQNYYGIPFSVSVLNYDIAEYGLDVEKIKRAGVRKTLLEYVNEDGNTVQEECSLWYKYPNEDGLVAMQYMTIGKNYYSTYLIKDWSKVQELDDGLLLFSQLNGCVDTVYIDDKKFLYQNKRYEVSIESESCSLRKCSEEYKKPFNTNAPIELTLNSYILLKNYEFNESKDEIYLNNKTNILKYKGWYRGSNRGIITYSFHALYYLTFPYMTVMQAISKTITNGMFKKVG